MAIKAVVPKVDNNLTEAKKGENISESNKNEALKDEPNENKTLIATEKDDPATQKLKAALAAQLEEFKKRENELVAKSIADVENAKKQVEKEAAIHFTQTVKLAEKQRNSAVKKAKAEAAVILEKANLDHLSKISKLESTFKQKLTAMEVTYKAANTTLSNSCDDDLLLANQGEIDELRT